MSAIDDLLTLSRVYMQAEGVSTTTLSHRMFNDGKKLTAIEAGRDIQVTRYERAVQWLSDNWPKNSAWPADISRPVSASAAETASP
jgi:hypothetical protein